jgi:hypothetical protein
MEDNELLDAIKSHVEDYKRRHAEVVNPAVAADTRR